MIIKDFDKKVLFWKLRGIVVPVKNHGYVKRVRIEHENIRYTILYIEEDDEYLICLLQKTSRDLLLGTSISVFYDDEEEALKELEQI